MFESKSTQKEHRNFDSQASERSNRDVKQKNLLKTDLFNAGDREFRNKASSEDDTPIYRSAPFGSLRPPLRLGQGQSTAKPTVNKKILIKERKWNVTHTVEELPIIPLFVESQYCVSVDSNDILLKDINSPSAIAERIVDCLYQISAVASYRSAGSEVYARVTNFQQSVYMINMYRGRPLVNDCFTTQEDSKSNMFVTVEIQKRRGDRMSFHSDATAIMEAVCSKNSSKLGTDKKALEKQAFMQQDPLPVPDSLLSELGFQMNQVSGVPSKEEICLRSIENISKMLNKESNFDQTLHGMEELVLLTDNKKTCSTVASEVVKNILSDRGDDALMRKILNLVMHGSLVGVVPSNQSPDIRDGLMQKHVTPLRNLALQVLVNVVSLSTLQTNNTDLSERCDDYTIEILLPLLAKELSTSTESDPYSAYLCAKCLASMVGTSVVAKQLAHDMDVEQMAQRSLAVGKECHALLEYESRRVLTTLQAV